MKKYQVNVHYDAVICVSGIIADSEEEALQIASEKASTMSLNEAEVIGENSCVTRKEEATKEDVADKIASRIADGYFEIVDDGANPQIDGTVVEVDVLVEDEKYTVAIDVDVHGKNTGSTTTDGPHGRTLYREEGFSCDSITPKSVKVDGVPIPSLTEPLKKALQEILDDTDAIEGFNSSQMY